MGFFIRKVASLTIDEFIYLVYKVCCIKLKLNWMIFFFFLWVYELNSALTFVDLKLTFSSISNTHLETSEVRRKDTAGMSGAQPEIFHDRGGFVKLGHSDKQKKFQKKCSQREKFWSFIC